MNAGKFSNLRWLLVITLVLGLGLSVVQPVQAAEFDNDGRIEVGEVINDDVFLAGDQVVVDGTVNGLLFATGRTVTINGVVDGDLIVMGEQIILGEGAQVSGNIFGGARLIDLRGQVGGSLFGGASEIRLGEPAAVARNVYLGAYSVSAAQGSTIGRDIYAGAYQTQLNGAVSRNAALAAAAVELNGSIGGNVLLEVGDSGAGNMENIPYTGYSLPPALEPGLRISADAQIGGELTYTSNTDYSAQIQSQPAGGVVYQTPTPAENDRISPVTRKTGFASGAVKAVRNLITLLILGALALWWIPAVFKKVVDQAGAQPLPSAGVGFLSIIVTYVGALVAAGLLFGLGILFSLVTLGGLSNLVFGVGFSSLGLALAVFTFLLASGSKLVASYLVGDLIFERLAPQVQGRKVWALVVGVLIYVILAALPFIGWVFAWIATFVGLGAMWFAWRNRKAAAPAEVEAAEPLS